jgi:polyhydroxyalkanoate synthesis regulator phasin
MAKLLKLVPNRIYSAPRHSSIPKFLSPEDIRAHANSRPDSDDEGYGERSDVDDHGQPRNRWFNHARVVERTIDELVGLSKGLIADGTINEAEARFLAQWMQANQQLAGQWPVSIVYQRMQAMLHDQHFDHSELQELLHLLSALTGNSSLLAASDTAAGNRAMALALTDPPPSIVFHNRTFCLTGEFVFGTRAHCEAVIRNRRGRICSKVISDLDYLIIGQLSSRDWIHPTHGRKLEAAVELASRGRRIAIVSEQHWRTFLKRSQLEESIHGLFRK